MSEPLPTYICNAFQSINQMQEWLNENSEDYRLESFAPIPPLPARQGVVSLGRPNRYSAIMKLKQSE